ncbi:MAG: endonuclease III [Actinobacteria bacterium]|nr:endonuclease III [Actinomycetota bacterium]
MKRTQIAERAGEIIGRLKEEYKNAGIVLNYSNDFELLVAVILSAQCTDKKVNEVTAELFKKYRDVGDYARAGLEELERDVRPTGFFRNKAKSIKGAAVVVLDRFGGKIPSTMDEILELPGVARKTANIVLGNAHGVVVGIAVDTHVKRLSRRLGLTENDNPDKIERDLMEVVPNGDWFGFTYLMIEHGRAVCDAKKPRCDRCLLNDVCPSAFKVRTMATR